MKTKKMTRLVFSLLLMTLILSLAGCHQRQAEITSENQDFKGNISISGAFALYPMTVKWAEEFMKQHPDIRIDISAGGAGKGMTDALSGMVDLGMFSRGVSQAEIDKGAWYIAVTKDAVVPTINASNPALGTLLEKGFTIDRFEEIYLTENEHYWEEFYSGEKINRINVYTRSDACGAAEIWGLFLGKNQEGLYGVGVFGDPGMADAVKNDKSGIGFNNIVYAYDMSSRKKYEGLEILPIDFNANGMIDPEESIYNTLDDIVEAIQTGAYPSPPARDLYFVANGKPSDPIVIRFLEWILTEGQQYVGEAGYVMLSDEKINTELLKLKP